MDAGNSSCWLQGSIHRVAGTRHAEYLLDTTVAQARCGLDPQSRGVACDVGIQQAKTTNRIPLSLDGRGPKPVPVPDTGSEGEQDNHPSPVILALRQYPQGGHTTSQNNLQNPPPPLMGEESKPVPVLDTGAKGETRQTTPAVILALRQYPQGGATTSQNNHQSHSPLTAEDQSLSQHLTLYPHVGENHTSASSQFTPIHTIYHPI